MKRLAILLAACGGTPRATLPADVTKLVERWQMCWHFSGEEPYDAERAKQIADGQAAWCPGNEEEQARLRTAYVHDAAVQDALRKLDDQR